MARAPEGAIGVKLSTPRRGCSGLAYSVDYVTEEQSVRREDRDARRRLLHRRRLGPLSGRLDHGLARGRFRRRLRLREPQRQGRLRLRRELHRLALDPRRQATPPRKVENPANNQMAEREGFEPSIRFCRILTFQASAFDHSATAPHALEGGSSSGRAGAQGKLAGDGARSSSAASAMSLRGDAACAVGREQDVDPVPDVRPVGMMVGLLRRERDPGHEGEGRAEIGEA